MYSGSILIQQASTYYPKKSDSSILALVKSHFSENICWVQNSNQSLNRLDRSTVSIRYQRPAPTVVVRRLDERTRNGIGDNSFRQDYPHL